MGSRNVYQTEGDKRTNVTELKSAIGHREGSAKFTRIGTFMVAVIVAFE